MYSARPRLAVICPIPSNSWSAMLSRMRSASTVALEIPVFGMRIRNSSPPHRVRESDSRMAERMQFATSRMTWSPTGWPKLSLTRLKWSMSSRRRVMGCPYRLERWTSPSTTWSKCRRFQALVSRSVLASCSRSRKRSSSKRMWFSTWSFRKTMILSTSPRSSPILMAASSRSTVSTRVLCCSSIFGCPVGCREPQSIDAMRPPPVLDTSIGRMARLLEFWVGRFRAGRARSQRIEA